MSDTVIFAPDDQSVDGVFEAARRTGGLICVGSWEGKKEWSIYCYKSAADANQKLWEGQEAILVIDDNMNGYLKWQDNDIWSAVGKLYWSPSPSGAAWTYVPNVGKYLTS